MNKSKMNKTSAFAYSIGYGSTNIIWYMINTYLMLFYTDVVGLAAGAISIIMLVARIWDAINDPMMGMIVDRTETKWGKFRPYIVMAPPVLAVFNILTFTVFPLEGTAKAVICLLTYIGAGMAYTVVSVAINSLLNRLSDDSQIKMNIVSMSQIASTIAQTVLGACVMPMILFFGHSDSANGTGFFWTTVVLSVISIPLMWFCAWKCKEVVGDSKEPVQQAVKPEKRSIWESLKLLVKNKNILITVVVVFAGAASAMGRMSILAYYIIYVVGSYTVISLIFPLMTFCQMIGNATLPFFTKKLGKKNTLMLFSLVQVAGFVLMFIFPADNMVFLIGVSAVIGFTMAGSSISYGMMCDSIDYGEYKYGVREEALASSFMSFAVKLASAVTGSVSVLLLAAVGFVANEAQTPTAITGINAITNLVPGALVLISLIPVLFYKLDNKTMEEVKEALATKKASEA